MDGCTANVADVYFQQHKKKKICIKKLCFLVLGFLHFYYEANIDFIVSFSAADVITLPVH
jgi:hypothetical protein